jgi:hypothetical protein
VVCRWGRFAAGARRPVGATFGPRDCRVCDRFAVTEAQAGRGLVSVCSSGVGAGRFAYLYAALAPFGGRGDVYEVDLDDPIEPDGVLDAASGDSVCAPSATVIQVVERHLVAKKRQTFGKIQRERERAEKRARKLGKKEETKAAALAAAELGITVEELAELEGRTAPESELSPTDD